MTAQTPDPDQLAPTGTNRTGDALITDIQRAGDALLGLGTSSDPLLAGRLARLVQAVATEAARTQRFAHALAKALEEPPTPKDTPPDRESTRRSNRRSPGVIDPFAVFTEEGEIGLRERLATLSLEQLRDIVAEHGMDHDRLAMKWKDRQRVADRIVDRVAVRAAKGSAFRSRPSHESPL